MLDVRKLMTGKDGQIFLYTRSGAQIFLAECDEFTISLDVQNTDYQPVGSILSYAVNTGTSISITLNEAVVRDDVTLDELLRDLADGYMPSWDIQGKLSRRDGGTSRITVRNCIPDGSVDLMAIQPGEIVKRNWTFRGNSIPEKLASL